MHAEKFVVEKLTDIKTGYIKCPCCGDRIYVVNYVHYCIQKYYEKNDTWKFVTAKELKNIFNKDINCPSDIKNLKVQTKLFNFCTIGCANKVINYLNSTNTGKYRWCTRRNMLLTGRVHDED